MSGGAQFLIVAAAAAVSAGLIAALMPLLRRYSLARPNPRSSHLEPTPQGGGIAVIATTIGVAAIAILVSRQSPIDPSSLALVLAAAAFIALVGAIDDIRIIGVAPRILLQAIAVGVALAALPPDLRVVPQLPWWIERVLLLVAWIWFVNLTNFMDGIDWMTVTEVVPISGGLVLIGMLGALPVHGVVVALALGGAMIGFAPFNRPVARLFLGDVGSLPIGLLFGWLLILLAGEGHLAAALLLPLYYIADATITLLRRIVYGEKFWEAHRSHFYQRALDNGLRVIQVVTRVLAVNLALVALAVATVLVPGPEIAAATLLAGATLVGGLLMSFARGR
jgi:UDP-N-acetylmuramyl pentapeptide phosphotransferase/UDP-N-acetylglucosamine-1-phosphate transferase